jgi:hypothetical protein
MELNLGLDRPGPACFDCKMRGNIHARSARLIGARDLQRAWFGIEID